MPPDNEKRWRTRHATTGTETVDGLVLSEEYLDELRDLRRRVKKYRRMRSDPAVDTALKAGEKTILGAQWTIVSETDGGEDAEVRDFLEDNLYPHLDRLIGWLLGSWQFGWATVEPVFEVRDRAPVVYIGRGQHTTTRRGQEDKVWLHRLVHLLPESIEGFRPDRDSGQLGEVEQAVYIEGTGFIRPLTPGWKVMHAVHEREGDDFSGRSMLRSMYMPWDIKLQLLRSFAVHWDRFGTGTPHMQAGAGWEAHDFERAEKYLKAYRAGTEGFLITPHGGELTIFAGEEVTKSGPMEMIEYLDGSIAKVALSQFTELGTTATGHRSLSENFLDVLETSLQGFAEYVAMLIQQKTIIPLVDMNYGERDQYPVLRPAVRLGRIPEMVKTLASAKGAGLVGWTAEDEVRLRDMTEMPSIDLDARQAEMDEEAERTARAAEAQINRGSERRLAHTPDYQRPEDRPSEALATIETEIILPRVLAERLDGAAFRLANEADAVLADVTDTLVKQAGDLAEARGIEAGAAVNTIEVPDELRTRLAAVVDGAADRAFEAGERSVRDENERQVMAGLSFSRDDFAMDDAAAAFSRERILQQDQSRFITVVDGETDRVVTMELSRRENTARSAMLNALRAYRGQAALSLVVRRGVRNALEELSPAVTRRNLEAAINVAFGAGRQASAEELIRHGEVAFGVRSEVMDRNTCGPCFTADGTTYSNEELLITMAPPFPDCLGGTACRGLFIYVRPTERPALV